MSVHMLQYMYGHKGGDRMSPKGRPTDDPKTCRFEIRISEADIKKLDFCCEKTSKKRAEVIRMGIQKVFDELSK